jgi:hypothetical protein
MIAPKHREPEADKAFRKSVTVIGGINEKDKREG